MTINNQGLAALTVEAEQKEIKVVGKRKIKFAFFQSDFQGGRIPYWNVMDPLSRNYQSTLSMEGLKDWGIL